MTIQFFPRILYKKKKKKRTATITSRFSLFTSVPFRPVLFRSFCLSIVTGSSTGSSYDFYENIPFEKSCDETCSSLRFSFCSFSYLISFSQTFLNIVLTHATENHSEVDERKTLSVCIARIILSGSMDRDRGKKRVRMWKEQERFKRRSVHGWRSLWDIYNNKIRKRIVSSLFVKLRQN